MNMSDEYYDTAIKTVKLRVLDRAIRKHLFFTIQNNLDKTVAMKLFNCLDKLNWNTEYDMIDKDMLDRLQNYPNNLEGVKEFEELLEDILLKIGVYK